jgi:hypothetical protein
MKQTIDYIEQYRLHYERGGYGNNDQTVKAKHKIRRLVAKTGAVRLLDYGCGECRQYSEHQLDLFWGIYVTKYDPAIPEVSETPKC